MKLVSFGFLLLLYIGLALSSNDNSLNSNVKWSTDKDVLNVFVIPHSHNDPGWWWSYEDYYNKWTRGIITSVIDALAEDEKRTFVWCETSFFSLWWNEQDEKKHQLVRMLVANGQLEFVGGGWVMNDEASVTISDIITQYTYGHRWLLNNVGPLAVPTIGWAIDPFGHSPAMAWSLREMGFKGMVINRVQKNIKNQWRDDHKLEFRWEKEWNMDTSSCLRDNDFEVEHWEGEGMLTHMLPYKLYDIPNTCGPDWDVCEEFDFERKAAKPITTANVKERSETLLGQYRKKAKAFEHNNLLVPLGDDFKYKDIALTRKMMSQYQLMFDYMNSHPELKVRIRFATLSEYFDAIKGSVKATDLPQYNGDFFTYNDEGSDFWSGFFTTRPYLKRLIRSTSSTLRTAQELFALYYSDTLSDLISKDTTLRYQQYEYLENGLKAVSLVQHHDGVTGTCRQPVANDYTNKLLTSSADLNRLIGSLSSSLLCSVLPAFSSSPTLVNSVDASSPQLNELTHTTDQTNKDRPITRTISLQNGDQILIVFNSLSFPIDQLIQLQVDQCDVKVINNQNGREESIQVNPHFPFTGTSPPREINEYSLFFVASLPPLSYTSYLIQSISQLDLTALPNTLIVRNSPLTDITFHRCSRASDFNSLLQFNSAEKIELSNSEYTVDINTESGLINSVYIKRFDRQVQLKQSFATYNTRGGAYLFRPQAQSSLFSFSPSLFLIRGDVIDQISSYSYSIHPSTVIRLIHFNNSPHDDEIQKSIQLTYYLSMENREYNNKELVTRFDSDLANRNSFYTDGNNLDLIYRVYDPSLPIQGNFYPISALFTVPDYSDQIQMNVISNQPYGMGIFPDGDFEIVLDRKTMQDDSRGMGEPVTDNAHLSVNVWLAFEKISGVDRSITPFARHLSNQLEHIPQTMFTKKEQWEMSKCLSNFNFISPQYTNTNINLFAMQPYSKYSNQIVIRVDLLTEDLPKQKFPLSSFLSLGVLENRSEFTLSLLHKIDENVGAMVDLLPMSMRTYVASLSADFSPPYLKNEMLPFHLEDMPPINTVLNYAQKDGVQNQNNININNNNLIKDDSQKGEELYILVKGDLQAQNQNNENNNNDNNNYNDYNNKNVIEVKKEEEKDFDHIFVNTLSHKGVKYFHLVHSQMIPDKQSYFLYMLCAVVLFLWITILYTKRKRHPRPIF